MTPSCSSPTFACHQLMYASVSTPALMDEQGLEQLFHTARRNNARDGITGALMADGRLNIQFIEGPQEAVTALWQKIQTDERHHFVVQLLEIRAAPLRLFAQWSMLRGQASRAEMLALVKAAQQRMGSEHAPEWVRAIGPLLILLDGDFSRVYAQALGS